MGGGLMQLVASGAQDIYLTGNPQITFFKVVFKRHTNFSIEPVEQPWFGEPDFGKTVTCTINRTGDLLYSMHVIISLPAIDASNISWGYVNRLGHALINNIKLEIGGQVIDQQYGDWLNIWYELSHKTGQENSYNAMIGNISQLTSISVNPKPNYILYIPVQFWFNRHSGLALPIIALQYHDVRISVTLNTWENCVNYMGNTIPPTQKMVSAGCFLLIDYVYLDSDERKKFAQVSHEYLIEQVQYDLQETIVGSYNTYRLNFYNPTKYIVWATHLDRYVNSNNWLTHANITGGDWNLARNRFAQLMVIACSTPVSGTTSTDQPIITNTTIQLPVSYIISSYLPTLNPGEIVQLNCMPTGGFTQTMLNKVNILWIIDEIIYNNTQPQYIVILLTNAVVVSNTLSIEDISQPINILQVNMNTTGNLILTNYNVSIIDTFNYANFVDGTDNPVVQGLLQLNGHDRFQIIDGNYLNYVQPFQHFSNTPSDGINMFSFALKPEEYQPTGTCNFSRVDNASLQVNLGLYNSPTNSTTYQNYIGTNNSSFINIFAVNYNVLRIMSGMAGLQYNA